MDTDAARRARRKAIVADLRQAITDEEAVPPEWVDLYNDTRGAGAEFRTAIERETERFVNEPDIRRALGRREKVSAKLREQIDAVNGKIRRLNLIVPDARWTRPVLDTEALLRPLFRTRRTSD
jgi:hypothetical protein